MQNYKVRKMSENGQEEQDKMPYRKEFNKYIFYPEPPLRCTPCFSCIILIFCVAVAIHIWFHAFSSYIHIPVPKGPDRIHVIHREGNLVIHPARLDTKGPIYNTQTYSVLLPPANKDSTIKALQDLVNYYSEKDPTKYRDCWMEHPTYREPCFFHKLWLGSNCIDNPNFGYQEVNGTFNPCLILRLEQTGSWMPIPEASKKRLHEHLYADSQFSQIYCFPKMPSDGKKVSDVVIHPAKGFANQFFPVKNFDPSVYKLPAVAVQFKGIPKGQNVTVNCMLDSPNSLMLRNLGFVEIKFLANL